MTNETNPNAMSGDVELRDAIAAVRRRWRRRRVIEGLPVVVAAMLVAVLLGLGLRTAVTSASSIVLLTRAAGYLVVAAAIVVVVLLPLLRRVSDEQAALYVEERSPGLAQLLLSAVSTDAGATNGTSPQLHDRIVRRALEQLVHLHEHDTLERNRRRRALARLAAVTVAGALLIVFGPVAVRQVARVLFVPWAHAAAEAVPVLTVTPGDVRVPRGAALDVRAAWHTLADHGAEIVLRPDSTTSWVHIPMVRDSTTDGYVARVFDINHNTSYYVDVGSVQSPVYHITVTDQPTVRQLSIELRYPAYTGLPPVHIDNGGDVVAVTGTVAIVTVEPTLSVHGGALRFDDGSAVAMTLAPDGHLTGSFRVAHDGFYRVDLIGTDDALAPGTVQHSVEALVDHPPTVRIDQPGRDTRVTSIEEVPIGIRASDDYGVRNVELHYAVNGGADHNVAVTDSGARNGLDVRAVHTLLLEDLSLHVGDLVAYHATARDGAGHVASSDIYFMEVRPFSVNYHGADDNGGGGGGGEAGGDNPGKFTDRQRELVAGTFNWVRDSATTAEHDRRINATTLAIAQGKLSTDVSAQAKRMVARGVAQEDSEFVLVQAELDSAATAMHLAEDGLGRRSMHDAIPPQELALQHLQAADEAYRDITVRRGAGGGGGGGGGGASNSRDLADLFELQTDKLKNQYETPRSTSSTPAQQAIDSVADRLKQLAARQQEANQREQQLAQQMQQRLGAQQGSQGAASGGGQSAQQAQGGQQSQGSQAGQSGQPSGQQGQRGQQSRGGAGGQSGQASAQPGQRGSNDGRQSLQRLSQPSGGGATGSAQRELARQAEEQARQLEKLSREQNSPELADAAQRAQQAADAMRQAAAGSAAQGAAALDRLRDAAANLQSAETSSERQAIGDLARRAGALGSTQRGIARDVAALPSAPPASQGAVTASLQRRKDALRDSVNQLAADADRVASETRSEHPRTAAAAANAAAALRNGQVAAQIDASKRVMQGGLSAEYSRNLESLIGETLDSVSRQLQAAAGQVGAEPGQREALALARTRDLVRDMESLQGRTADSSQGGEQNASQASDGPRGAKPAQQGQVGIVDKGSPESGSPENGQQAAASGQPGQQGGQSSSQSGAAQRRTAGERQGRGSGGRQGSGGQAGGGVNGGRPVGGGIGTASGVSDVRQFRGEVAARQQTAEGLRRDLVAQGVDVAPLDRAIAQMQQLQRTDDGARLDQLQAELVAGLKNFEFTVWRKFNAGAAARPALGAAARVPPEYRAMVEEYYRALARNEPK